MRVAQCIESPHFQVAERALFLWNNDVIATFMSDKRAKILPILWPALDRNIHRHWNATVTQLTQHILQQFMDMDQETYYKVQQHYMDRQVCPILRAFSFFLRIFSHVDGGAEKEGTKRKMEESRITR